MLDFITDRTRANVDRCKELSEKGWNNLTDSEKAEWAGEAAKGAYNYSDLNRVETAVAELATYFGLSLTTKTDWGMWDNPTQSQMDRYLANVLAVKNKCPSSIPFPALPDRMNSLSYESANNIEITLALAYRFKDSVPQSGDLYCGEV